VRVKYGNVWLASGGVEGTSGTSLGLSQQNDEKAAIRAAATEFFDRGGRRTTFGFTVTKLFASEAALIAFFATHIADLPGRADLQLFADDAGDEDTSAVMENAVLDSLEHSELRGVSLRLRYSFSGGVFTEPA
jgi:hypothetical protein